jgi:hypothetical protein
VNLRAAGRFAAAGRGADNRETIIFLAMDYAEFNEHVLKQIAKSLGVPAFLLHPARGLRQLEDPRHVVMQVDGTQLVAGGYDLQVRMASGTVIGRHFRHGEWVPIWECQASIGKCVTLELLAALRG